MSISLSTNSLLADTFFGSKSSVNAGSFLSSSSLGDWNLMRSGIYTKMMQSYYDKVESADSTSSTTSSTYQSEIADKLEALQSTSATNALSSVKSTANAMSTSAEKLEDVDYEKVSRDDLYSSVKALANNYNALISSADKTDLTSITQSVSWMENDVKREQSQLKELGITIETDGTLAIDKEKFAAADVTDIQSVFDGTNGLAARLSQRGSGLANLAANHITYASGNSLYTASGLLG